MKPDDDTEPPTTAPKRISTPNRVIGLLGLITVLASLGFIDSDFTIRATGRVELARSMPVFAERGGLVDEVRFREGDAVEAGEVVLKLREPERDAALLEVEQQLAEAEAAIERAEFELRQWEIRPEEAATLIAPERLKWLDEMLEARRSLVALLENALADKLVSPIQVQQEQLALLDAESARLESGLRKRWLESGLAELTGERLEALARHARRHRALLEKELTWLERERKRGDLDTPLGGRIAVLEYKYPGMAVPEGGFAFEVVDENGAVEVEALVGERNFDLLEVGGEVRMRSKVAGSILGDDIRGVIAKLPIEPSEESAAGPLYEVEIALTETPFPLVHGSTVDVEFVLGRRTLLDAIIDGMAGRNSRARLRGAGSAAEGKGDAR